MRRSVHRLVLVAATAMLISGVARAEHPTDSKEYYGGPGDAYILGDNIGGAVFDLDIDEFAPVSVTVEVNDDTGLSIGAYWQFEDGTATDVGHGSFCDSAESIVVPPGALQLAIFIDGPQFGPADCLDSHTSPGIGVHGLIDVTYGY